MSSETIVSMCICTYIERKEVSWLYKCTCVCQVVKHHILGTVQILDSGLWIHSIMLIFRIKIGY